MKAGFYEWEVTPPLGGFMWGHYKEIHAQTVLDRLYIKACVVEEAGEYAAIVAVDTCALLPGMHEVVASRVAQYTPIQPHQVCISSNHSHSGAPISSDPSCGGKADEAYVDVFLRLCADTVVMAYRNLAPVEVKYAFSQVSSISFNRNFITKEGTYITHGRGKDNVVEPLDGIDPDVPVLFFEKEGEPVGAIVNFACHQCCLSGYSNGGYSGDYSSYLSKHLKKEYGNEFVSLFVLGACGDINHVNPDINVPIPSDWYQHMGKVLASSVIESMKDAEPVSGGVKVEMETVEIPRRPVEGPAIKAQVVEWLGKGDSFMRSRNLIHYHANHGGVTSDVLPVQSILIGDVLISSLPGEVYHAFGKKIKKNSPYKRNMIAENCNEYCGYIPTPKAFSPNNKLYETALCRHSCLVPEAGDMLVEKALSLAEKIKK